MSDPADPRVRVLKAEHEDIAARLERAEPPIRGPKTVSEIHDRAADTTDSERMADIEKELNDLAP